MVMTGALMADGLSIDPETGLPQWKHEVIRIDATQLEEVTVLGSLTLSAKQWAQLRKQAPSCPKRITSVLPNDWNDCMCGVEGPGLGVQVSDFEVAILLDGIDHDSSKRLTQLATEGASIKLSLDRRGQFYHEGALVRYPGVLEALQHAKEDRGSIALDIPLGLKRDSSVMKTRIDAVEALTDKAGWRLWVY